MSRIPKIIHYCWFGSAEIKGHAKTCIESWHKYLPDYEIRVWNEHNISFDECQYAIDAFNNAKWAFLSDYVRLKVLSLHGGVYFDTDVEVISDLEKFLDDEAFMCFESNKKLCTAVIGAKPFQTGICNLRDSYLAREFILPDGKFDYTTNVEIISEYAIMHWGLTGNNNFQKLKSGITVYPSWTFSPLNYKTGLIDLRADTIAIHHFNGSWISNDHHKTLFFKRWCCILLGKHMGVLLYNVIKHVNWRLKNIK